MSFSWQIKVNDMGAFRYVVVAETGTKDLFQVDYAFKLLRDYGAGEYEEYYGFGLDTDETLTSGNVSEHYFSVSGFDPDWLLNQPILLPVLGCDQWAASGPADDLMKAMVQESIVDPIDVTRKLANFTAEGNMGLGLYTQVSSRYTRLLSTIQELAGTLTGTDFRVVRAPGGFDFRTYCPYYGTDRRRGQHNMTLFSPELGNVINLSRKVARSKEIQILYGGWEGVGGERTVYTMTNPVPVLSPYRRREEWVDIRDSATFSGVYSALDGVFDSQVIETVTFDAVQTEGCVYGRDWECGDLVTLDLWDDSYSVRIVEVDGAIDGANEETIVGKAELWTL
jgi:hypothetical protein